MSSQDPKADLLKWANSQVHLPPACKAVLKELASFADADGCAWAKIDTLAYGTNVKERQVQRHLEALREAGLIKLSGRAHRLKKSTRSVPLYQLAPEVFEALEGAQPGEAMGGVDDTHTEGSMGGVDDTHADGHGCHGRQSMGGVDDTPHRRSTGDQSGAKAPSPGARADLTVSFAEFEAAVPVRVWKFTDRDLAFEAFCELLGQGVEATRLAGCARRMGADPVWLSKRIPSSLEAWLGKGQWRGWDVEPTAVVGAGLAEAAGPPLPPDLSAALLAATDAAFMGAYLTGSRFEDGPEPRLVVRSQVARDRLQQRARPVLQHFKVSVVVWGKT